jgi:hypothetical protein
MKPEKLKLLEFAVRVMEQNRRARLLTDGELTARIRQLANEYFPADSEELSLLEELIERFEKLNERKNSVSQR